MHKTRTGDPALIREINLSIVLNALREHPALSRASLANTTGLTKATVSHLVEQLVSAGLIVEGGRVQPSVGRPRILLQLKPQAGSLIGIELGVDFLSVLETNFGPEIVWRHHEGIEENETQTEILARIFRAIQLAVEESQRNERPVLGVALGVPGLVDVESGTLIYAPNLHWANFPLLQKLSERFALPILVDNEASMAAFGEMYFGVARGTRNMVFITAGVGIGGGLMLNGSIVPGATGFAGEVGHMTIDPDGPMCNCGNRGCWETFASQLAVYRRVQEYIASGKSSSLQPLVSSQRHCLTIPIIVRAADEGDVVAQRALQETGKYLGIGIANLINACNPEMIVLGGILSVAKEYIMPVIQETVQERALRWSSRAAQIKIAANVSDACAMGGVAMVYDQILRQPLRMRHKAAA